MSVCRSDGVPRVHDALASRFSPASFDPEIAMTAAEIDTLLDAARSAPSAGNSQPWRFIVAVRGDDVHARLIEHLAPSSRRWAVFSSLLVVNLAQILIPETDWEYSEFARYDLGQAVAYMSVQALSIGYDAHQFRAFDRDGIAREFAVPREWEVTSMTAFGVAAVGPKSDDPNRNRLGRSDIVWSALG